MHVLLFFMSVEIGRAYPISRGKNVSFFISFYRKMKLHTKSHFVLKAHAPPPKQDAITNNKPY